MLLERHKAFWMMEETDRPLMSIERYNPLQRGRGVPLVDGRTLAEGDYVTPEMIEPRLLLDGSSPWMPYTNERRPPMV